MLSPRRPEGYEELLTYWNHYQNRYKYRDKGYDEMLFRAMKAMYYACISFIDFNLGRILAALGDEIDNTLILFTADHGEMLGDYGSVGKRTMLNPAAKVPLIVRPPGVGLGQPTRGCAGQPAGYFPDLRGSRRRGCCRRYQRKAPTCWRWPTTTADAMSFTANIARAPPACT